MSLLPSPGTLIGGKYRIIRCIGEGGMGAIFEAENALTHKRIAIKWLQPSMSEHAQAAARMLREAQAAARIRHPNVVDIYDVEREGSAVFLVMELLVGESLRALLDRAPPAMHEVIALLIPAMRGVAVAHKAGVVHRDIKPDNIFLAREAEDAPPVPKVIDFGISKLDPRTPDQLSLTRTGGTLGTPLYMSYEQLAGVRDVDGRADVYAFGAILYEALTGKLPFEASTYSELVVKIATQAPERPQALRPELPDALAEIVLAAMEKDRERRIPNLTVLVERLQPFTLESAFRASKAPMTAARSAPTEAARFGDDRGATTVPSTPVPALSSDPVQPAKESPRSAIRWVGAGAVIGVVALGWYLSTAGESTSKELRSDPSAVVTPSAPAEPPRVIEQQPPDDVTAPQSASEATSHADAGPNAATDQTRGVASTGTRLPVDHVPQRDANEARLRRQAAPKQAHGPAHDAAPPPPSPPASVEHAAVPAPAPAAPTNSQHRVFSAPKTSEF